MSQAGPKTVQSKISVKSQTVLPREVRERLGIKPGDTLVYRMDEDSIRLEKSRVRPEDDPFAAFTEWASAEDDDAYANL